MKDKFIRNFKFWFATTQKVVGLMLAFGFGYTLLFNKMINQDMNYMFIIAIVSSFIFPITYVATHVPLIISFGATRKEAALGFQIMNILSAVELEAAVWIHKMIFPETNVVGEDIVLVSLVLIIWGYSIGQICGSISLKFGKGIGTAVLIIGVMSVTLMAMIFAYAFEGMVAEVINMPLALLIVGVVGIVVYVISIFVLMQVLKNYEVKNVN